MATLYIEEFENLNTSAGGQVTQAARQPSVTTQTVAIGAVAASSNAFGTATRLVRIHTDAACSYEFGTDPEATTAHPRLGAEQTEYFLVSVGDKISVIENV
jgi:hypothetical protein